MVGHGGSSASSYLADPTSPIPSHCASIVTTSTVRVKSSSWVYIVLRYDDGQLQQRGSDVFICIQPQCFALCALDLIFAPRFWTVCMYFYNGTSRTQLI